jgi:diguanylate cyclase
MILKKSFNQDIEQLFLKSKQFINPQYIRGVFSIFILFYALFFLVDLFYFSDQISLFVLIRFGIVIPVLLLTVISSFTKHFHKFHQYILAFSFLIGGLGIAYMLTLEPENVIYSGGLFIVVFSGYLLISLRFYYASISGTLIILFYVIGYYLEYREISTTLIYSTTFFVSANIIGMIGSYNIEKSNRLQFLDTIKITEVNSLLQQQYNEKNKQLEMLEKSIVENRLLQSINEEIGMLTHSLKESESKFRQLFENAPFGYQSLDNQGFFLEVNRKWLDIFGYQKEEVVGKWFGDFLSTDKKEQFAIRFEEFKKNGHIQFAFAMKTKTGEMIHASFDGNISYDENHKVIQTHCTVSNTTESHIANKKLKQSEEQYRLLTTEMQLGLALHEIILDDSGKPIDYRFISINDSYERLTGLKRENVIGKTVLEVFPNTEKYWIETFGEVAFSGKSTKFENYASMINKYFSTYAYSTKKGQFAVIVDDITDRIYLENQRKEEHHDLLISQKIAKLGTWRLNTKTNEVTWSDELYKMYGFDPTLPPPPYTEHMKLFTKSSWEKLSTSLAITSTKGTPYELELEMANRDSYIGWMWVRGEAEYDNQGNIVSLSGAAQDITKRKHLEQELNETNQIINTILDQSPVAVEFFDYKGNHLYSNQSAIELFGIVKPLELKGLNLFNNPNLTSEIITKLSNAEDVHIELEYDFDKIKENKLYFSNKSGRITLELSITPLKTDSHVNGYIVHSRDVTERKMKENEILHISNHDFLTNIPNRRYFSDNLEKLDILKKYPLGIMMIDINGLKLINDAFGYKEGDKAIQYVATTIKDSVKPKDVVARLGGDEFGIIIPNTSEEEMIHLQEEMTKRISEFSIEEVTFSIAIGSAVKFDESESIDGVIKVAEESMYKRKVLEGRSMRSAAINTILETLTNKYDIEKVHLEKVSEYCYKMGVALNLNEEYIEELKLAGLLHDIGKISIPDHILSKPGKLDGDEWEIMKKHTIYGYNILRAADEYSNLALYALTHHEKYDGTGYPKGLSKEEIPLFSRIISVVDAYEAMTADRPYRKAPGHEFAIQELVKCKHTQFDPKIVDVFLSKVLKLDLYLG